MQGSQHNEFRWTVNRVTHNRNVVCVRAAGDHIYMFLPEMSPAHLLPRVKDLRGKGTTGEYKSRYTFLNCKLRPSLHCWNPGAFGMGVPKWIWQVIMTWWLFQYILDHPRTPPCLGPFITYWSLSLWENTAFSHLVSMWPFLDFFPRGAWICSSRIRQEFVEDVTARLEIGWKWCSSLVANVFLP